MGSCWDRVNILHSSPYSSVFWICAQNSVDNAAIFYLLLSSACTVSKLCLFCHSALKVIKRVVSNNLGGDTAKTVDLNSPKGIP